MASKQLTLVFPMRENWRTMALHKNTAEQGTPSSLIRPCKDCPTRIDAYQRGTTTRYEVYAPKRGGMFSYCNKEHYLEHVRHEIIRRRTEEYDTRVTSISAQPEMELG